MGAPLPSSAMATVDALQQFTERRRERFVTSFPSQCSDIVTLIEEIIERGPRGPVKKLRQLARRMSTLARIVGLTTVSDRAIELERCFSGGPDTARALDVVQTLPQALAADLKTVSSERLHAVAGVEAAVPAPAVSTPSRRMLIVDDHAMVRSGIRALLSGGFAGATFGEAQNAAGALDQLHAHRWDIAVLDVSMPGRNGVDLIKEVKTRWPRLPVLVVSAHAEHDMAVRALRAGAAGYLTKASAPDELVRAVRKILDGGRYVTEQLAEQLAFEVGHATDREPHATLSDREYDVACRIASGKTVSEIADEMSLSVKTISTYRTRVLEKLGLRNNAEIVQYAIRNGLVC